MIDIVLLNPNIYVIEQEKHHYSVLEHLGLGLLASCLGQEGYTVKIVDAYAKNMQKDDVVDLLKDIRPKSIGITSTYLNWEEAVYVIDEICTFLEYKPFIFLGGEHCTYSAKQILEDNPKIDAVVRGEGEITVVDLMQNISNLERVDGIFYRDRVTDCIVKNKDRQAIEILDNIPFAIRDTLDYCKENNLSTAIGVLAQRGCHADCSFCNAHRFFRLGGGKPVRIRSPKNIADELEFLYKNFYKKSKVEKLYFYDATFITGSKRSKNWAKALAREILDRDIVMPFEIYLRSDSLNSNDQELISLLKDAGLCDVFIGIESFDEKTLELYDKETSPAEIEECLTILDNNGILGPTQGVIMFSPFSTFSGLRDTARFLKKFYLASFWNISQKLQLFPGVKMIGRLESFGLLHEYDKSNKVYSYRFVSDAVENAANFLDMNKNEIIVRDNALPRLIKSTLFKMYCSLPDEVLSSSDVIDSRMLVDLEMKKNNDINVDYFERVLDYFEGNGDPNSFILDEMKQDYLETLSVQLNEMEKTYNLALKCLYSFFDNKQTA